MENKKERVCIGKISHDWKYQFHNHLKDIRGIFTPEKVESLNLEFSNEILQDMMSGGEDTIRKITEKINNDLMSSKELPVFKKEKEKIYKEYLEDLQSFAKRLKNKASDFPSVLPEHYHIVSGTNMVDVSPEVSNILEDMRNVYIEAPECIEAYNQAQKVIQEVAKLKELVKPYSCDVFGKRGVLEVLEYADEVEIAIGAMRECHQNGVWSRGLGK